MIVHYSCTFVETFQTWFFGVVYLTLLPLLMLSLGMGWRAFSTTVATLVWVMCADVWETFITRVDDSAGDCYPHSSVYEVPIDWRGIVVLGIFAVVLLRFAMPVMWNPSHASFLRRPGAGVLHRIHAAFLVCVVCSIMAGMVFRPVLERSYYFGHNEHRENPAHLDNMAQPVRFA